MNCPGPVLLHTLEYFISMNSYFDEQLYRVELTLYAQNNTIFLPNFNKAFWVQISVSYNLSQVK